MPAAYLRLVTVDGARIAHAPRRTRRNDALRQERAIQLAIIAEHLGHVEHSLDRLRTLTKELEASCGIALPPIPTRPLPDALSEPLPPSA